MPSLTTMTTMTTLTEGMVSMVRVVSTVRIIVTFGPKVRSGKDQPNRHHDHAATMSEPLVSVLPLSSQAFWERLRPVRDGLDTVRPTVKATVESWLSATATPVRVVGLFEGQNGQCYNGRRRCSR
jgi:hypothetical protein